MGEKPRTVKIIVTGTLSKKHRKKAYRGEQIMELLDSVKEIKGIGSKKAEYLEKLGIRTVEDMLLFSRGIMRTEGKL